MPNVRTFQAIYELVNNISTPLKQLKQDIDSAAGVKTVTIQANTGNLGNKIAESGSAFQKSIGGGAKVAEGAVKNVGKATEGIGEATKKVEGGFGNITRSAMNLHTSITRIAGSLAGIAAGGAIAGFSYLTAAKSDLYVAEVYKSIDANKKFGISSDEVKKRVAAFSGVGWTSSTSMLKNIQAAYTYGGTYAKGTMEAVNPLTGVKEKMGKGEVAAQAAAKIAFNYVGPDGESLDPKDLLASVYRKGKLMKGAKNELALELGVSADDRRLDTVAGRIKLLNSHLGDGLTDQPWKIAQQNLSDLQKSIGQSIAPVMKEVTGLLAGFIKMITNIPGGSALIGTLAILISLASILSLIISVGAPVVGLFTAIKAAMFAQAVAAETVAVVEGTATIAEGGVAAGAWAMAAGLWASLAPILLIAAPLIALAGILYLVESKTHIFSKAFKELGKTQMAKDFFNWFRDLGKWIDQAISSLDKLYKSGGLKDIIKVLGAVTLGPAGMIGAVLGGGAGGPDKLQENLVKYIYNLYNLARAHFPWLDKVGEILKKIQGIFEWLYSLLQGLWNWLKSAIPGAKKEEARGKLEKELKSAVPENKDLSKLSYAGMGMNADTSVKEPMFNWNGKKIPLSYLTGGKASSYGGTYMDLPGLSPTKVKAIGEKATTYEKLPDMWGSIAKEIGDAVKTAVSTIGSDVGNAVKEGIKDLVLSIPGMKEIGEAIDRLTKWLDEHGVPVAKVAQAAGTGVTAGVDYTVGSLALGPAYPLAKGLYDSYQKSPIGSTIRRPGLVNVSKPGEEVVSAARVEHGPGAVAKALDMLNNLSSGHPMAVGAGGGPTTIQVTNHNDFSGMKVASGIDIDKLLRQIDKRIETKSVDSVKRALGQRRT